MGQENEDHTSGGHGQSHTPSTPEGILQRVEYLSRMSEKLGSFLTSSHHHGHGHGHGHHQKHVEYKRPEALTNELALYSLQKLSHFDSFMELADQRVLQPVAPGVASWGILWGFAGLRGGYAAWTFMLGGYKALLGKRFLATQLALWAVQKVTLLGVDNVREWRGTKEKNLVARKYRAMYGDQFLLDALEPSFFLGKFAHPQNHYGNAHAHH